MNKFFVILQYEFTNYVKNKSYVITTFVVAMIAAIIMCLPSFINMDGLLGFEEKKEETKVSEEEKSTYLLYDSTNSLNDFNVVAKVFGNEIKWEKAESVDALKNRVEKHEVEAGFVVNSLNEYTYYVYNNEMFNDANIKFNQVMIILNQATYCAANGLDYGKISVAFAPEIKENTEILGKDMTSNYWYCYALVIVIFMIIIMYGVMVATSVTQEKSNRTIEVLVTSADTNALFFGKVIAGTIAAFFQMGIWLLSVFGMYQLNKEAWHNMLDSFLNIPADVVITFMFFGIGGVLFYTFIYGAMGALVSKTEDINKSAGGLQMIIMIVYFVVLLQLTEIDGMAIKVASFLPVSSYSAMFARVAMGTVAFWEVAVSFAILVVSIVVVGIIGAKIYRMGTLRYGNPIKFSNALKMLKQDK